MNIPDAVLHRFSADPLGPLYTLEKEAGNPDSPVYTEIDQFLASINAADVAKTLCDPDFRHLNSVTDRSARIWIAWQALARAIAAYKLDVLRRDAKCSSDRPRPYNHPALNDLELDKEHLLPLRHFDFDGTRLLRNGHAFLILSTTDAPNSTHWLIQACHSSDLREHVRVRLDPLLHGSQRDFNPLRQFMWVYGRPLDWNRVARLQRTEHGRWWPDRDDGEVHFTDYAWKPRDSEIAFVCEEVPTLLGAPRRAGRYLHAVYRPSDATISHLDGAVRIYTTSEIIKRHDQHVRSAGKIGERIKVFRVDEPLARGVLSSLCLTFFVWNDDVCRYFWKGR